MSKKAVITFVGAGNMASSLIGGLIADQYDPKLIWATNPAQEKLQNLQECFGINTTGDNQKGISRADVIVFCVKPSQFKDVVLECKNHIIQHKPLLISVVTGIHIETITKWLNENEIGIVRCMPNTPCLVGSGATALFPNQFATDEQKATAESVMRSVGLTLWLEKEKELDIVTALSGSGPAYFFLVMQALQDSAVKLGMPPNIAKLLTVQTALGSARMALESSKDLLTLKKQVTSKGGTTEQALNILEKGGLVDLFYEAILAAKKRAEEMADLIK